MKTKIQIKSYLGELLFEHEAKDNTVKKTVEKAVKVGANLVGARLDGARLDRANLVGARLDRANLDGANLVGANLVGANLDGANLVGARLDGARLDRASLDRANLVGANLVGANLVGARLDSIKNDFWSVLCSQPLEVDGLRKAIVEGRINGSSYEGECACLVGTIANVRGCQYNQLPVLKPDSSRPAEVFFLAIKKGDNPENSQFSKIALSWLDEWVENMKVYKKVK